MKYIVYNIGFVLTYICLELTYIFEKYTGNSLDILNLVRSYIIIITFIVWTYSLYKRIINKNIRNLLMIIGLLLVFWMSIRSIKYYFVKNEIIIHYLWYCYYIPLCFIPILWLYVAMLTGKSQFKHGDNKWIYIPFIVSLLLCLLVFTNDYHQLVFKFNTLGRVFDDINYEYGIVYYILVGWDVLCTLIALAILFAKCRNKKNNKLIIFPILTTCPVIIYVILYALGFKIVKILLDDITRSFCIAFMLIIESTIISGLIASNTFYKELFAKMEIPVFIVDNNFKLFASSKDNVCNNLNDMKKALDHPVLIDDDYILSSQKIRGGIAFYQNKVREYIKMNEKLKEVNEELKERVEIAKKKVQIEKKKESLIQENKLYNKLQLQNNFRLERIEKLITDIEKGNDDANILLELSILGVYFKRRNNLLLNNDDNYNNELEYSLKESFELLKKFDIEACYSLQVTSILSLEECITIYDSLEVILEKYFKEINSLVFLIKDNIAYVVLTLKSAIKIELKDSYTVSQENEKEFVISYYFKGGKR